MRDEIIYGGMSFGGDEGGLVLSGCCCQSQSLAGDELTVDTLTVTVESHTAPTPFTRGAPVLCRRDGALTGKFYLTGLTRTGKNRYRLDAVSAIGLLDGVMHYGGIYNGLDAPATVPELAADIIGDRLSFTVDGAFDDTAVYGWLPAASARDNLRQLLFACGAGIRKSPGGDIFITALSAGSPKVIPTARIFIGGEVREASPATAAIVTEHSFIPSDSAEPVTLYEGEIGSESFKAPSGAVRSGGLVLFDAPARCLAAEGAELLETGPNYAVLSPSACCTLRGRRYVHATRQIMRFAAGTENAENVKAVRDATLVSAANSGSVADRVLAYYSSGRDVECDVLTQDEQPGDAVSAADPFGVPYQGFIRTLDRYFGEAARASVLLTTGYTPTGIGNNYKNVMVVNATGSVTLPNVSRIRVVLIGGGNGGQGAENGENGAQPTSQTTVQSGTTGFELVTGDTGWWQHTSQTYTWYESAHAGDGGTVEFETPHYNLTVGQAYNRGAFWRRKEADAAYRLTGEASSNYSYQEYSVASVGVTQTAVKKYYAVQTRGGRGGSGGVQGLGGLVYQMDLDITPGGTASAVIGSGGVGGSAAAHGSAGGEGGVGGATTLTVAGRALTSADGVRAKNGFIDIFTGTVLALPGKDGMSGGDGGAYEDYRTPCAGGAAGDKQGGGVGAHCSWGSGKYRYGGGSGGGASADSDGGNGGDPHYNGQVAFIPIIDCYSGSGGNGGAGVKPPAPQARGCGGSGGNGGGGGGNAGGALDSRDKTQYIRSGAAGAGGAGADGGDGADGAILIFY